MPDEKTPEALLRRHLNVHEAVGWIGEFALKHARQDGGFTVTEEHIKKIHFICMSGLLDDAETGCYRQAQLRPLGKHRPPRWEDVVKHMQGFVKELNKKWYLYNPIQIGAYAIWRLNWIHPFINGNGRTSRLFGYLLMNMRAGYKFPGKRGYLVPEQLGGKKHAQYVKALRHADKQADDSYLKPMEEVLSETLRVQLTEL
ncbi:MAG: Fic family protein [Alphaproteobacteria bacterium GM202ARS2]|nr:Fic family protein [Alphaproteobacteria bacterium GM202ARS2]